MSSSQDCTHVTARCPVSETLYRHPPYLAANALFTTIFAVLLVAQLGIGIRKKTWSYMIWVSLGCFGELLGYIGRLIMHANPWNETGIEIQIICLVLAPSFLAAGIYLTLKHIVIHSGTEYSRLRPELYPWIFVGCDSFSILLQAIGGGVAAGGGSSQNQSLADLGDDLIIAGIAMQIFSMLVFAFFAIDFYQRRKRAENPGNSTRHVAGKETPGMSLSGGCTPRSDSAENSRQTTFFYYTVAVAYVMVLVRCIYRIHEMAGGWYNARMRNEVLFLILDGAMIVVASIAMTIAHPGLVSPPWRASKLKTDQSQYETIVC